MWLGLSLVALCSLAIGGFFGATWYVDKKAHEKLAELADRAGVDIKVSAIIIQPGSRVTLHGLVVTDRDDGRTLVTADRVITNLTFDDLRAGKRRPGRVVLEGLDVNAADPQRFADILKRWKRPSTGGGGPVWQPEIRFTGARVTVPKPLSAAPSVLTELTGRVVRRADRGWVVAAHATLDGERSVAVDVIAPPDKMIEAGVTFEPPLAIERDGVTVTVSAAWARRGHGARLKGVELKLADQRWATAAQVEVHLKDADGELNGAMEIAAHGVSTNLGRADAKADRVKVGVAAGALDDPLRRLRYISATNSELNVPQMNLAVAAGYLGIETDGITSAEQPLSGLKTVSVASADIQWVLPSAAEAAGIPYYQEIQAFLMGDEPAPTSAGGGPSLAKVPEKRSVSLLGNARPTVSVKKGTLALHVAGQEEPAIVVEGLEANLTPGEEGKAATVSIKGSLEELSTGEKGRFEVRARTNKAGGLVGADIKLSGSKLATQLAALSDSIRLSKSSNLSIDLAVTPHLTGGGMTVSGRVGLSNMGFLAPRIHKTPVDGLKVEADLTADLFPLEDKLVVGASRIQIGDAATMRLTATIQRLKDKRPKLDILLEVPEQDCSGLLIAIPPVMVPRLAGLELTGKASGHLKVTVDLAQPRTYTHDLTVNMDRCKPVRFGRADVPKLKTSFVHNVVVKGEDMGVTVGPGTWHYKTLQRIPKHIQMGALATEDHTFFKHSGFRPHLIRRAVVMNLEGGRYVYGGSTITQQLVKNLFLSREKTLTRKLEEAWIVWLMERTLSKKRMLELYLNCIEYGPRIYGIENAARAYFGKRTEDLSVLEGAFLMGLKPYPWAGWQQRKRGYVRSWWYKRLKKVLTGMRKQGWITESELIEASSWDPIFVTSTHLQRPKELAPQPVDPPENPPEAPPLPEIEEEDEPPETPNSRFLILD